MNWRLVTMLPKHPGFNFFQIISPDLTECCVRMVVFFGGWMIH